VQQLAAPQASVPGRPDGRRADLAIAPAPDRLAAALAALCAARRPVLVVGQGARGAVDEVRELAERLGAPVLTTFRAKGLLPDAHPLAGGVLGRSGTPVASWLMNESDLLLVVGASFANHTGIAPYKPIVQVDDSAAAIGRFHPVTVGLLADAAVTLRALRDGLRDGAVAALDQRPDVAARWAIWRAEKARRAADDRGRGVASAAVFAALTEHCPADAVITVDVGNHAYSFGRYFESSGQPVLMSGYLGSIGFGYPAALGAWAATLGARPVVAVTGDGGFGQYLAELTTAVKYGMAIKHVLLDNRSLGKISKEQLAGQLPVWQTSLVNPGFAEYARCCGATGIPVARAEELADGMKALFAADGPALLHVHADAELV
jgi:thiamine pyrophosphate-dependent acetolactate synthase large subunit-like protein